MKKNTLSRKAVFTAGLPAPAPSVTKPAALATDAGYAQFTAKCDDVVKYCNARVTTTNSSVKQAVSAIKNTVITCQSMRDSVRASYIPGLNQYIGMLE